MTKILQKPEISFEKSELEKCLNLLKNHNGDCGKNETEELSQFLGKFAFFRQMPCKFAEIRDQEINSIIEKCRKYMHIISFNGQEILIERGRKVESIYLVLRGKFGLYLRKTPEEVQVELANWRKVHNTEHHEGREHNLVEPNTSFKDKYFKRNTLTSIRNHNLGSLAKDNISKFHVRGPIYSIKEVGEVILGYHLFENVITDPQTSEYTVLSKEPSVVIAISVSDYHLAINELRATYKHRYKLLQKNLLTADDISLNKIAMYFTELKFSANETVFKEEDNGDNLYCVASGEIYLLQDRKKRDIVARGASYLHGYKNLIDTVTPGDFFGDEWFFYEKERKYTAIAKSEETVLLCLTVDLLARLSKYDQEVMQRLKSILDFKRELRRKKNDHLDKKRSRDYQINLTDLKDIINHQTNPLILEKSLKTFKSEGNRPYLKAMSLHETSLPKRANSTSYQQKDMFKEKESMLILSSFLSPQGSKFSSLSNLKSAEQPRYQNYQRQNLEMKWKFSAGNTPKTFHSRKASTEESFSSPAKPNVRLESLDRVGKKGATNVRRRLIFRSESTPKISSKDVPAAFEFESQIATEVDNSSYLNNREVYSVKGHINSLETISNKIAKLSSTITHEMYLLGLHRSNNKNAFFSHKHTRSTQLLNDKLNIWNQKNQECQSLGQEIKKIGVEASKMEE